MNLVGATKTNRRRVQGLGIGVLLCLIAGYAEPVEPHSKVTRHQVNISGFEFVPKELKISSGDIVTWVNKDIVPHNITVSDSQELISPELAAGDEFTFVVKKSVSYECGFHPSMKGKIVAHSP